MKHAILSIGIRQEQIRFFYNKNIKIVEDIVEIRMERLNSFMGKDIHDFYECQWNDIVYFLLWYQKWLKTVSTNIKTYVLCDEWYKFRNRGKEEREVTVELGQDMSKISFEFDIVKHMSEHKEEVGYSYGKQIEDEEEESNISYEDDYTFSYKDEYRSDSDIE